jgi:nucleoside-diphosphate-sugar epimerase
VKKNLYITGGHGQDGIILTNILLSSRRYRLHIITNKKRFKKINNVTYYINNLQNRKSIKKFFLENKPDIIIHLACKNPAFNQSGYNKFFKQNIIATKNIVDVSYESNNKIRFIFANSSQIFKKKNGIVNEFSKYKISTSYTRFRIEMNNYIKNKIKNYTNAILFNHDSKFRNKKFLIPRIVKYLKNKNYSRLKNIIKSNISGDFSHAEDICYAIYKIIDLRSIKKIIISSGYYTDINQIIFFLIKKFNINIDINFNYKKKKLMNILGDNTLLRKIINYKPKKNIFIAAEELFTLKKL